MIRMLIVGYSYCIRSEWRLCEEVELHLAYHRPCRLDHEDEMPHHSTLSANRLGQPQPRQGPEELDRSDQQRQRRTVSEYVAALDESVEPNPDRKVPKVISPSDPASAWTRTCNEVMATGR